MASSTTNSRYASTPAFSTIPRSTASTVFHGHDLATQPFLTKRGRKINQLVRRIFVIVDGYLFYFQHAAATEPCGVISLDNSEFVAHAHAPNVCFELRTPARPWGGMVLHYHKVTSSTARKVEQTLQAAGSRHRAEQFFVLSSSSSSNNNSSSSTTNKRNRSFWSRRASPSAGTPLPDVDVPIDSQLQQQQNASHAAQHSFSDRCASTDARSAHNDATATSFSSQTSSSSSNRNYQNLLCVENSNSLNVELLDSDVAVASGDDLAVELCHELCVHGFVKYVNNRKLLAFLAPFWPWSRQRRSHRGVSSSGASSNNSSGGATFTVTISGTNGARIRFATTIDAPSSSSVQYDTTPRLLVHSRSDALSSLSEQLLLTGPSPLLAGNARTFMQSQQQRTRAASFPFVFHQQQQQQQRATQFLALCAGATANDCLSGTRTSSAIYPVAVRPLSPPKIPHGSVFVSAQRPPPLSPLVRAKPLPLLTLTPPKCFPPLASPLSDLQHRTMPLAPSSLLKHTPANDRVCFAPAAVSPAKTPTKRLVFTTGSGGDACALREPMLAASTPPVAPPSPRGATAASTMSPVPIETRAAAAAVVTPTVTTNTASLSPVRHLTDRVIPVSSTASTASATRVQSAQPLPPPVPPKDIKMVQAISLAESYSGGYLLKQYEPLKTIGCGGFGHVMVARHKRTNALVAIKTLSKKAIAMQHQIQHSLAEKAVLTMCRNHPFIIQLHASFQTIDHLHLVLDYCPGGELFFHLAELGRFREHQAAFYAAEVFLALEHLHKHDIIYRDLKPENVLLDKHGHVQLADFGLSKLGVDDWTLAMTFCGSIEYLAPEVLALGDTFAPIASAIAAATAAQSSSAASSTASSSAPLRRGYGKAADFWALGCLLFEMLTGEPPFYSGNNRPKLYARIMAGTLTFPPYVSPDAVALISSLLVVDPAVRLGSRKHGHDAVKDHAFFTKYVDWPQLLRRDVRAPLQPRVDAFANFDKQFTSMPVVAVDKMTAFPAKIPVDYQLFENYNWEPQQL